MKLTKPIKLKEIAHLIRADLNGQADKEITGINEIHKVEKGDLTFVDNEKYYDRALKSKASAILIDRNIPSPNGKAIIVSKDPFSDYNALVSHFVPFKKSEDRVSKTAKTGRDTVIMPGVFLGNDVTVGDNCLIHPNVTVYDHAVIGDNVIIHANTVIGADAFYYKTRQDKQGNAKHHEKMHSCGRVIIEDGVEIGANCTIDKGVSGDTVIGKGTKIDNLVHIGHGTVVGKNCIFAAQAGIGGKCKIGDEVILWGQVGISKDLAIGDKAVILSQSGVSKSLEGGKVYFGYPAEEARTRWKELAALRNLPEIWERIKKG